MRGVGALDIERENRGGERHGRGGEILESRNLV